jgi:ADP-ribose pyrophosphatase YjhB (NUDIX family)
MHDEQRKFADFYEGALWFQMSSIPEGGMCLSAFLAVWKGDIHHVLLGKVNSDFDWVRIGALDRQSASRISSRWMLPSSHLLLYESPTDAAKRILMEQLGLDDRKLKGPLVFSEVYDAPKYEIKNHWDMEFVFTKEIDEEDTESIQTHLAWSSLEFQDVRKLEDKDFARNHQDILSEIGAR